MFTPLMRLEAKYSIIIHLPGFLPLQTESFQVYDPSRSFKNATWKGQSGQLVLLIFRNVSAGTFVNITIVSAASLLISDSGLERNDSRITISTDTPTGPVLPTAISDTPAMNTNGSVLFSSLTFDPPHASFVSNITFRLVTSMPLSNEYGDYLVLNLPNFSGRSCQFSTVSDPPGVIVNGIWNADSHLMSFYLSGAANANESLTIFVPSVAGIALPVDGVRDYSHSPTTNPFTVVVYASEGSARAAVSHVQPVGSFGTTPSISYFPATAGSVVAVNLSFVPMMQLSGGEEITFRFPFLGRNLSDSINCGSSPKFESCTFYGSNETSLCAMGEISVEQCRSLKNWSQIILLVRNGSILAAGHRVSFLVEPFTAIYLSAFGVSPDLNFSMASDASAGMVLETYYRITQPVGLFLNSSFHFWKPYAGISTNITIRVQSLMNIHKADTVNFFLPRFTANFSTIANVSGFLISWNKQSSILRLKYSSVQPITSFTVMIPAYAGLTIPKEGITSNDASDFLISTDAIDGPVISTVVHQVQLVGSLGSSSSISFSLLTADFPASILVSFSSYGILTPADEVIISFPGFEGPTFFNCTSDELPVNSCLNFFQGSTTLDSVALAIWNQGTSSISISFNSTLASLSSTSFTINSNVGITIPNFGVRANQATITIALKAASGVMLPTAFSTVRAVGAVLFSSLNFTTGLAGQCSEIIFKFIFAMDLLPTDSVYVTLPRFTLRISPSYSASVGSSGNSASWRFTDNKIGFHLSSKVSAGSMIVWSLPSSAGVILPLEGVRQDQSTFVVESNASLGVVPMSVITNYTPVGAFWNVSVDIQNPKLAANITTGLSIFFTPLMILQTSSEVYLYLPGFRPARDLQITVMNDLFSQNATWTGEKGKLVLTVLNDVINGTEVNITISEDQGFMLPTFGLLGNRSNITIGTNCPSGPVWQTTILNVPSILSQGSIWTSKLSFSPAIAGSITNITLTLQVTVSLYSGDKIFLELGGFQGSNDQIVSAVADQPNVIGDCSWDLDSELLTISISGSVQAYSDLKILLLTAAAKITIPNVGIRPAQSSLTVAISAIAGSIPASQIMSIQAVGSFNYQTTLALSPRIIGGLASISLSITPGMTILTGESIQITLPQFTGNSSGPRSCSQDFYAIANLMISSPCDFASWNADSNILVLNISSVLPIGKPVTMIVPSSLGIRIPSTAILQDFQGLTIGCNANDGYVCCEPIKSVTWIGEFSNSRIEFLPGEYLQDPTVFDDVFLFFYPQINIFFTAEMNISSGETVFISLPGFQRDLDNENDTVTGFDSFGLLPIRASWLPSSTNLLLITERMIVANFSASISVPSSFRLRLPQAGIQVDASGINIASNAVTGPVLATSFSYVRPVGVFSSTSLIFLFPARAGEAVDLIVSFQVSIPLEVGDQGPLEIAHGLREQMLSWF